MTLRHCGPSDPERGPSGQPAGKAPLLPAGHRLSGLELWTVRPRAADRPRPHNEHRQATR
jgi:hypothetical protein